MPWDGRRVCHCRAGGTALLTMALLRSLAERMEKHPRAAARGAGMEQGVGSRMRSDRVRGSKDPEPLRNPVELQLKPPHS